MAHMLGNLKIFTGPEEINAYARFLREVGQPELGYGTPCGLCGSSCSPA